VRVLGIDPGSSCTGYGILDSNKRDPKVIVSGVIKAPKGPLADKLAKIFSRLEEIIKLHRPDVIVVEEIFHARNTKSALVLGHARGVALLAAGLAGVEVSEYSAKKVKQTVTGHGNANKHQVCKMLEHILSEAPSQHDASDALAVALCHLRWCNQPLGAADK
jgi:crossover junction endodeoxyribonuclease RuvC